MLEECLENVRKVHPLIHCITNYVTVNDVANILLATGASPIMADAVEEAAEITAICSALIINIGTLNSLTIPAMFAAGKKAAALYHPIVLDPVGAGASGLRTKTALELMETIPFSVIRGNISEIKTLAAGFGSTRGVDADISDAVTDENLTESISFINDFAQRHSCIVAVSGAIDLVSDGTVCYVIRNGCREMGLITGTGCQLSALTAAFAVANPRSMIEAVAAAVCTMGLAGEIARSHLLPEEGNLTLRNRIIDSVYTMNAAVFSSGVSYEIVR